MKILALDISMTSTGAAIGAADQPPRSFGISFPGEQHAKSWAAYNLWLRDIIVMEKPALVVYEAPIPDVKRQGKDGQWHRASVKGARLLSGFACLTETMCQMRGIGCQPANVLTWRKAFLSNGRPAEPKEEAMRMCNLLGWDHGGSHDRAEAMGVWCWGHLTYGDRRAMNKLLSAGSVRAMR